MNVLSLFSGIGGLDLGLERAGMTVVGQVEIDPWCRKVLAKHWPEVPRHDDVRTAARWWGDRTAPDLVAGGFPCQPVSLAGKGLAQADSRWLWPAFHSVIRHLRPRYVLVENVPGLLGRGMGDVLGDLAAIGYDAEWDCVPAAFVGAPHIRNRVWIIAYPNATGGRLGHQGRHDGLGTAGLDAPVPDAEGSGRDERLDGVGSATSPERPAIQVAARGSGGLVADPASHRRTAQGQRATSGHSHGSGDLRRGWQTDHAAHADREPLGWPAEPRCERGLWAAEPHVGRVAHGIPGRLDRLRGLGNAVVPQVAEHIGRLILAGAA